MNRGPRLARNAPLSRALRAWPVALLLGVVALGGGCQNKIGDPCKRAINCSLQGNRQCDVSNADRDPNADGECTIEGCSRGSCPKEAACVKVYSTQFLTVACDPDLEDIASDTDGVVDVCLPNEVCLPEGLCADEISARTSCRLECDSNKDCRSNYECVATGDGGLYWAPSVNDPKLGGGRKICVPR